MIIALELIAESLKVMAQNSREMKEEQTKFMELSQREAVNAPARVKEMFNVIKEQLTGGADDDNGK
jgi:hypothetical protein